jgi:hypothetical protein
MFLRITIYNLFNFGGGHDAFLGQLCLLLGKTTSCIHLLTPFFLKKKLNKKIFSLIPSKLFFLGGGGRFIFASNNNIIYCNTLVG